MALFGSPMKAVWQARQRGSLDVRPACLTPGWTPQHRWCPALALCSCHGAALRVLCRAKISGTCCYDCSCTGPVTLHGRMYVGCRPHSYACCTHTPIFALSQCSSARMQKLNVLPFIFIIANCISWVAYSFVTDNWYLFVPNTLGMLIGLGLFLLSYGIGVPDVRQRDQLTAAALLLGAALPIVGMLERIVYVGDEDAGQQIWGYTGAHLAGRTALLCQLAAGSSICRGPTGFHVALCSWLLACVPCNAHEQIWLHAANANSALTLFSAQHANGITDLMHSCSQPDTSYVLPQPALHPRRCATPPRQLQPRAAAVHHERGQWHALVCLRPCAR